MGPWNAAQMTHLHPPPLLLPWAGRMFPSDPPAASFPVSDHCLLSFQTACPLPTRLSPPGLSVTSHLSKSLTPNSQPYPSGHCSWLHQFTSCLISVRSVFNPWLWFSCPSMVCSKHPNQACASPEDISGPPRELLLKVLSCFFCLLPSQLAFCMLESAASASCPSIQLLSGSSYWIMWLLKGTMNTIYCCFSPHTSSLPFSFLFL